MDRPIGFGDSCPRKFMPVAARPKFELLAHKVFADDKSRSNASLAVSDGQLFLRNDQHLYCIGK